MLNPEFAQSQLQEIKDNKWQAKRLAEIGKLPEQLRSIGYGLFQRNTAGKTFASTPEATQRREQILQKLDPLAPADRITIFTAIFPQFAPQVEAGWQLWKTMPYQEGYSRRSFRLPNNPELTFSNRLSWLQSLIEVVSGYDQNLVWFADWAAYLGWYADRGLATLFAATINQGGTQGQEVLQILIDSAKGDREVGAMGRHVVRSLLIANNTDGWEFIQKLLLAAQRQEGLRQSILEAVDESHPIAYQRMLQLILDENLIRFSATIRSASVWFGFELEALNERQARQIVTQVNELIANPEAQAAALQSENAQTVYLALWCAGFTDGMAAMKNAQGLLNNSSPSHRYVAVRFLQQLDFPAAKLALLPALADEHLNVSALALHTISRPDQDLMKAAPETFDRLQAMVAQFPAKAKELPPLVWDWEKLTASQESVVSAIFYWLGDRPAQLMIPYLGSLDSYDQLGISYRLVGLDRWGDGEQQKMDDWDEETRSILFKLLGDSSSNVREGVLKILQKCRIAPGDSEQLEQLLTRKASELRRGLIRLLLNQDDQESIASAQRLLNSRDLQRQAGLELLKEMVQSDRLVAECRSLAAIYQEQQKKLTSTDTQLLATIMATEQVAATLHDALGLVDRATLTPLVQPKPSGDATIQTPASINCLLALDELVHNHSQTPVMVTNYQKEQEEELLANLTWKFPAVDHTLTRDENLARLPLADVWENWWQSRPESMKDVDGLELIRSSCPHFGNADEPYSEEDKEDEEDDTEESEDPEDTLEIEDPAFAQIRSQLLELTGESTTLRYKSQVERIVAWLLYLHPPQGLRDFAIDGLAAILQIIPPFERPNNTGVYRYHSYSHKFRFMQEMQNFVNSWVSFYHYIPSNSEELVTPKQQIRWWQLVTWIDRYYYSWRQTTNFYDVYNVYEAGAAKEADLIYYLLGAEIPTINPTAAAEAIAQTDIRTSFSDLGEITRRRLSKAHSEIKILAELADRCRQRILEVELQRGELPTAASRPALALRSISGIPIVIQLLQALDRGNLKRGSNWGDLSKAAIISHLMRISFPAADDTPAEFARCAANIPIDRLIQFAFYAPQWVQYIEHTLGWPGFADGVWWIHAHTKDSQWSVEEDVRDTWVAQIAERTPLSAESLVDGAVDVAWFQQIYQTLTAVRWQQLDEAAKYAASGGGHQRAKLFANAMLGEQDRQELIDRINQKRHQDSLRALGLLPLATGKKRDGDILDRYKILQEFLRTSKKFGSQRQASEKLAVSIGLENLARTAGYTDPQRLQWAMEAEAVADLAGKSQDVTVGEVTLSLSIDSHGSPLIAITKAGKALKAVPANLKKNPEIQALTARKPEITKQASRMRISLEQSMVRGDAFTATELVQLASHPVMSPMLSQLILIGENEMGYLVESGTALQSHQGQVAKISSKELRIAHPYDLLISKDWPKWQQECFDRERTQPFKQLFRELYVTTAAEQKEKISKRYEGHQVNPRQARALLGQRGWVSVPDEGVRRTFHQEGLIVSLETTSGYSTPLEVEGLTLYGVRFYLRDKWEPLPVKDIPPRLFSEVMRDLDLVVSVAHVGGVDPEASASTVEMRSTILRETSRLMKLSNVQIQSAHVLIAGHLGNYSVHLGSGLVHRQPGGALCIVPVSSQHRGRLFLPFVDDDPKTAEIISKVLLLAKDQEIQDPTILEQIL
jgi:hypothetical protein